MAPQHLCTQGRKEDFERKDLTKVKISSLHMAQEILRSYPNEFFVFADVNCITSINIDGKISSFTSKQDLLTLLKNFEGEQKVSNTCLDTEATANNEVKRKKNMKGNT